MYYLTLYCVEPHHLNFQALTTDTDLSTLGTDVERTCRCLLNHVHGSQSLVAAIMGRDYPFPHTLDTEYRRRRKYGPPHMTSFPETLSNASRAFLIGVSLGFSGLFPVPGVGKHVFFSHF